MRIFSQVVLFIAFALATFAGGTVATCAERVQDFAASDAIAKDQFGISVAVDGTTAIVGAIGTSEFYPWLRGPAHFTSGAAYLIDTTSGAELFKLSSPDGQARDNFGASVAIFGSIVIVGVPYDDDHGSGSGSAYAYDSRTGQMIYKLTASDAGTEANFGKAVAIGGNKVVVGANDSAYVFDAATGDELTKLSPASKSVEQFGYSVAVSGTHAIIGAPYESSAGRLTGSAYVFDLTTGSEVMRLTGESGGGDDLFGTSVAIDGNLALVGAPSETADQAGAAYLFDIGNGGEARSLFSPDPSHYDHYGNAKYDGFGHSVALSNDLAIVGAPWADESQSGAGGAAHLFDVSSGRHLSRISSNDSRVTSFGESVAINNSIAIIGGPSEFSYGSATILLATPEPTSLLTACVALFAIPFRYREKS